MITALTFLAIGFGFSSSLWIARAMRYRGPAWWFASAVIAVILGAGLLFAIAMVHAGCEKILKQCSRSSESMVALYVVMAAPLYWVVMLVVPGRRDPSENENTRTFAVTRPEEREDAADTQPMQEDGTSQGDGSVAPAMSEFACPNCQAPLSGAARACASCNAFFGKGSAWKPVPRSSLSPPELPACCGSSGASGGGSSTFRSASAGCSSARRQG